jgi:flagellar motor switch protein FliG
MAAGSDSPLARVAEVLVALGEDRAAPILKTFDEEDAILVAAEIGRVGTLDPDETEEVLNKFAEGLGIPEPATGGMRYAAELLTRSFGPERAYELLPLIDPRNRPFAFLEAADPEVAARTLAGEPAGVLALAMASIEPGAAAKILKNLDEELQIDLTMRIATIAPVKAKTANFIEIDLRSRIGPVLLPEGLKEIPGIDAVVEILGQSAREAEKRVLEAIKERDTELADRIREALFIFDDVAALDDRAIQEILKSIQTDQLSIALHGAEDDIKERFLSNLSTRGRQNLEEEMEFLTNVSAADVRAAQKQIVKAVRELEESGAITIERGGEDE